MLFLLIMTRLATTSEYAAKKAEMKKKTTTIIRKINKVLDGIDYIIRSFDDISSTLGCFDTVWKKVGCAIFHTARDPLNDILWCLTQLAEHSSALSIFLDSETVDEKVCRHLSVESLDFETPMFLAYCRDGTERGGSL